MSLLQLYLRRTDSNTYIDEEKSHLRYSQLSVYHRQHRRQNAPIMAHPHNGVFMLNIRASAAPRSLNSKIAYHHTRSTGSNGLTNLLTRGRSSEYIHINRGCRLVPV